MTRVIFNRGFAFSLSLSLCVGVFFTNENWIPVLIEQRYIPRGTAEPSTMREISEPIFQNSFFLLTQLIVTVERRKKLK